MRHVSQFFALVVAPDQAIDHGRLARLGMTIVRPDSICLDIFRVFHLEELFINVVGAWLGDGSWDDKVRIILRRLVTNLPKQPATTTSFMALGEIYHDVMVFAVNGFLNERLLYRFSVHHQRVPVVA